MKNKFKVNDILSLNESFNKSVYEGIKCKIVNIYKHGNVLLEVLKSPNSRHNDFPVGYQFRSNLDIWRLIEVILVEEDGEYAD